MEMTCKANVKKELGDGVWIVEMEPNYLPFFGKALIKNTNRTIIGLSCKPTLGGGGRIEFDIREAIMLTQGPDLDKEALFVLLNAQGSSTPKQSDNSKFPSSNGIARPAESRSRSGDEAFLGACEEEEMPLIMMDIVRTFFKGIREFADDRLVEGKARKWVTNPNNFLAITIQNRNKCFAIHVRKTPGLQKLHSLDVRDDRPGYARFWLKNESQIGDALIAAKASRESG